MNNHQFKIHSICLIKNEVDIIEFCLKEASQWSDYIYVYDNGSTDGTWEKVQSLQNQKIIAWKQDDKPFHDSLRGEVFNAFKDQAEAGDWWCRLDSDEFYVQPPKNFLSTVDKYHYSVWGTGLEYSLSQNDIEQIDFSQPIEKILSEIKLYTAEYSEPRFVRHRNRMIWKDTAWPKHMGLVHPERILYKHFRYRKPEQIQRRLDTRKNARMRGFSGWDDASEANWHLKLVDPKDMFVDTGSGEYQIDEHKLNQHLEPNYKRAVKFLLHRTGIWA